MKARDLILHCLGRKDGDQWVVMCLDFSLAVQADSLEQAKRQLDAQIVSYLRDTLVGQDREHAEELLGRRAPIKYWVLYWYAGLARRVGNHPLMKAFRQAVPLAPSHA